jgi:DNA-binding transcriptional LysR family regulator
MTVAARTYLARHGAPGEPRDLARHRTILFHGTGAPRAWDFSAGRAQQTVRLEPALIVNTNDAAIDAATAGFGIARALSYQVADAIASGRLVEVLAAHEDRLQPIHLVHAGGRRPAAKVRAFIDLAAARLRAESGRLVAR